MGNTYLGLVGSLVPLEMRPCVRRSPITTGLADRGLLAWVSRSLYPICASWVASTI